MSRLIFLAQIATPWDSSASWCYKTYRYGSAVSETGTGCANKAAPSVGLITLHVSQNLFEGSTGCHEWEAGFLLSEYVLSHADLFQGVLALSLLLTRFVIASYMCMDLYVWTCEIKLSH